MTMMMMQPWLGVVFRRWDFLMSELKGVDLVHIGADGPRSRRSRAYGFKPKLAQTNRGRDQRI